MLSEEYEVMSNKSDTGIYKIDSLKQFLGNFDPVNLALVVDENVNKYYGGHFEPYKTFIIPSGEEQKSFNTIDHLIGFLLDSGIDRHGKIIGIGGGVTCDITGFAASIYLRGVDFGFLPSTLLAMCDAAIGGKNGVNYQSAKNMIGVINQPGFIGYYYPFLETLPEAEYFNGMAEVIKHAIIGGQEFIDFLKENHIHILSKDMSVIQDMINRSFEIKSKIVSDDLYEKGNRKILNLGHTIGHAIEVNSEYTHGQSISIGMVMASRVALQKGLCTGETAQLTEDLCSLFHLPVKVQIEVDKLIQSIAFDKKRKLNTIDFIIPLDPGKVEVMSINVDELSEHLKSILHE